MHNFIVAKALPSGVTFAISAESPTGFATLLEWGEGNDDDDGITLETSDLRAMGVLFIDAANELDKRNGKQQMESK